MHQAQTVITRMTEDGMYNIINRFNVLDIICISLDARSLSLDTYL